MGKLVAVPRLHSCPCDLCFISLRPFETEEIWMKWTQYFCLFFCVMSAPWLESLIGSLLLFFSLFWSLSFYSSVSLAFILFPSHGAVELFFALVWEIRVNLITSHLQSKWRCVITTRGGGCQRLTFDARAFECLEREGHVQAPRLCLLMQGDWGFPFFRCGHL